MSIKQTLYLAFETEVFNTEEISQAEKLVTETNGEIYCWKTSGNSNWLEKGLSLSDVLGIVILPRNLPDYIDMLDDEESDE
jgi:hypothetical protein